MRKGAERFTKGDRVVFIRDEDPDCGITMGMTGTVVRPNCYDDLVGVSWDDKTDGHDCAGTCKDGTGWNVPEYMLDFDVPDIDISPDFFNLLGGVSE